MNYFSVKSASKPRKALAIALFCYMSQQAALGFALHRYSRGNEYITSAIFVTIGAVLVLLGIASKKGVLCALGFTVSVFAYPFLTLNTSKFEDLALYLPFAVLILLIFTAALIIILSTPRSFSKHAKFMYGIVGCGVAIGVVVLYHGITCVEEYSFPRNILNGIPYWSLAQAIIGIAGGCIVIFLSLAHFTHLPISHDCRECTQFQGRR